MTYLNINGTVTLRVCPEMRDALNRLDSVLPKDINVFERPGVATVEGFLVVGIHGETRASLNEIEATAEAIKALGEFAGVPARFYCHTDNGFDRFWVGKIVDVMKAQSERRVAKTVKRLQKLTADELDEVMRALQ